jgi:8-oxo-dGTP pyrophosphatase MutT (NUDIX family)
MGHLYRDCPHPIMSFGIICYRMRNGQYPEYLMIQRKDSLSFMEFIRGKYKLDNVEYIQQLLSCMTHGERHSLTKKSFEELWNIIWYQPLVSKYNSEFHDAKKKFESLREGIIVTTSTPPRKVTLHELLSSSPSPYSEPEWGFPKGRRKLREEDIDCAVREFCEETGFESKDIGIVKELPPFEEIFFGTNNVLYRHVYYIACLQGDQNKHLHVDPKNLNQAREVRDIAWYTCDGVVEHIRKHNKERKNLFLQAHTRIVEREKELYSC